ncbi:MAG: GH3 auxin-responsive promoter family protein, partial [Planctomycetota bacterium]
MRRAVIDRLDRAPLTWTAAVGCVLNARLAFRVRRLSDLEYWRRNTGAIQLKHLRRTLETVKETKLGREFGFARVLRHDGAAMLEAYRGAMPVRDYEGYRAMIASAREQGEHDVFWPGLVRHYAQTSGTTSGDKFMPLTQRMFRSNFLASLDIFANLMRWGVSVPRLMSGKSLFLGGSSAVNENEHGVATGDLSGLVTPLIRWPLTEVYSPGPDIALMDDWTAKIDAMAKLTIDQDIRMISGMPSWAGVLFQRVLDLAAERGQPARSVGEIWKNLTLFVHGGVKYTPFKPRLAELVEGDPAGDFPLRLELYPASEAFVALQDERGDPGLRLCADLGNFFEFVPTEEIDSDSPTAHAAWEVEKGQRYVVVLTTCAGLCRYVLGDVVEFDTIPGDLNGKGGE